MTYLFASNNRLSDEAAALRQPVPPAVPRELDKQLEPPYVVEPGDVLLVYPVELDSPARLPGDQPVLADGTINLGKYGQIVVAGHTVAEIEGQVRAAVAAQTKDAGPIAVRLVNRVSKVYYVLGEVNSPGSFVLTGRETVLDGILTGGGLTDRASRQCIILSRPTPPDGCRVILPVCYRAIVQVGDTTTNYQLAPGDRIYVPARSLCESLCPSAGDCIACGGPQTRCSMPTHKGEGVSLGLPVVAGTSYAPAQPQPIVPAPPTPVPEPTPTPLPMPRLSQ